MCTASQSPIMLWRFDLTRALYSQYWLPDSGVKMLAGLSGVSAIPLSQEWYVILAIAQFEFCSSSDRISTPCSRMCRRTTSGKSRPEIEFHVLVQFDTVGGVEVSRACDARSPPNASGKRHRDSDPAALSVIVLMSMFHADGPPPLLHPYSAGSDPYSSTSPPLFNIPDP